MRDKKLRQHLGRQIRAARLANGLTQRQLAEQVGIAEKYLSRVELGEVDASFAVVYATARALNLTLDALVTIEPQPRAPQLDDLVRFLRGRSSADLDRALQLVKVALS